MLYREICLFILGTIQFTETFCGHSVEFMYVKPGGA
jgi:hypothetical protein